MRLITAHRILIAASVIFFCGFSLWQLNRYLAAADPWALLQAAVYFLVAAGLALYFRSIRKWYG